MACLRCASLCRQACVNETRVPETHSLGRDTTIEMLWLVACLMLTDLKRVHG